MSSNVYTNHAASTSTKTSKVMSGTTPQTEAIPGRQADMKANNAGGVSFTLDMWGVLDRFIMIGSESAGYYVGEKDVTKQSFDNTKKCIKANGKRVVARVLEYSLAGRAPKNDPAVVVLALAAVFGNAETQAAAYDALPKVARTGTWLFLFVSILDSLGKWNAAAKRGVAKWYTGRDMDRLAVQLLKYQSRNGWAHRDVLRLAHVKPSNPVQSNLFRYAVGKDLEQGAPVPQLLVDFELLKRADSKKDVLRIVESNSAVSWEMVPTQWHKDKDIMSALLPNMGLTAVIRKLGALTAHGLIGNMSDATKLVVAKLRDVEALKKQRVHPVTILQAMKQYSAGRGERGSLTWSADRHVVDALDDSFYAAFAAVEPSNENYFLGVDISGSMTGAKVNGSPNLTAAEVAGVMALVIAKNEPWCFIGGFNTSIKPLNISPNMRLDAVLRAMSGWDGASTNCAAAFEYALQKKMAVDKFVIITDNETYAGCQGHPVQVLNRYRQATGRRAKCVVIGTSVSEFTIADPKDGGMLDCAGFDSAAPQIISQL